MWQSLAILNHCASVYVNNCLLSKNIVRYFLGIEPLSLGLQGQSSTPTPQGTHPGNLFVADFSHFKQLCSPSTSTIVYSRKISYNIWTYLWQILAILNHCAARLRQQLSTLEKYRTIFARHDGCNPRQNCPIYSYKYMPRCHIQTLFMR
jgi:hypothetical protein